MKRFLVILIFAISLLSYGIGHSQIKTDASDNPDTSSFVTEPQDVANKSPEQHENDSAVENEGIGEGNSSPIIERVNQLADRTDFTLLVSAIATIAAILSWLSSRAAVKITKEMSFVQARAYPGVGAVNYTFTRHDEEAGSFNSGKSGATVGVSCEFKNYGQTPAYRFRTSMRLQIVDYPGPENIEPATLVGDGYTLNPGNIPSISKGMNLSADQVSKIVNQTARIFVLVLVEYADYVGNRHWERVHFVLPSIGNGNRYKESHRGLSATMNYHSTERSEDK